MLRIEGFPEAHFHDIALEPEAKDRELAANSGVLNEPPLLKRLSIADPVVVPLDAGKAFVNDPDVAAFFTKHKDQYQFFLVRLACSFAPPHDEPISRAWVTVTLRANDGDKTTAVIALDPARLVDTQDVERNWKAGVSLEVHEGAKLGFEMGPVVKRPEGELVMTAVGIGERKSGWEMYRTKATPIAGIYVFNLLIQAPPKHKTVGSIDALMEIEKRFLFIPYKAKLAEHPFSKFVCTV